MMEIAVEEYRRLCDLAGKIPYGECELIALMISRVLPGSVIVRGLVEVDSGEPIKHFWVQYQGRDIDPLSTDWNSIVIERLAIKIIEPFQIIENYLLFLQDFPEPSENTMFPLRWKLKSEIVNSD